MNNAFVIFSFVFGLAVCAGLVARYFRQPAFLGHVLVGVAFGYWRILGGGEIGRFLDILSSAGVMLLLFLVGLEMNIDEVRKLGEKALLVGAGQIGLTTLIFVLAGQLMGVGWQTALFFGLLLSFSSTIIVVKLLSEKHDLEGLSGKIAVALLLIQDLSAIVMLIIFSGRAGDSLVPLLWKIILLVCLTALMAKKIMPRILHRLSKSTDELILFSLAWCFVLAAIVASPLFGLTVEIGGLLAGLALSGSFEHTHIATKIKPLRDFFLTIFFVGLGLRLKIDGSILKEAVVLTALVVVLKPLIVWWLLRLSGYRQRVAFYAGLLFGQISEFSLILGGVGLTAALINNRLGSLISLIGLMTMVISSYLIVDNEKVFQLVRPLLNFIWKDKQTGEPVTTESWADHIVLFGCHRMGRSMLLHLKRNKEKVLIVDFDPEAVARLREKGWRVVYADVADTEAYDQFNLDKSKMVVSTVKDLNDNLLLLSEIKKRRVKASVVVDAETPEDADKLYAAGATYVIFPHFVGGLHLGDLVRKGVWTKSDFESYRRYQQDVMSGVYA